MHDYPELRLQDDPFILQLIQMAVADPDDPDVQELLANRISDLQIAALSSGDRFRGNYPIPGSLTYPADFLPLGQMPTGDAIGLVIDQLPLNVGVLGPTGSGKTSLMAELLSNPFLLQTVLVILFARKPEIRNLAAIPQIRSMIQIPRKPDLMFSLFEPPENVPKTAWNNEVVRLIGQCYARFAAQRLLGDTVSELTTNHAEGVYPTLRQVAEVVDALKPRWGSREAQYKESVSWVLRDLLNCTGSIWDYSSSTFLDVLTGTPGLVIFELEDLPQEHFTFIASFVMRWLYFKRLYGGPAIL
jgi:hypothetical protein